MKYKICTPFTGLNSPVLCSPAFWFLLAGEMESGSVSPHFTNPQGRVIYKLQLLGMPAHNACTWLLGTSKTSRAFFEQITTYDGCEELLQFYNSRQADGDLASNHPDRDRFEAILEYADAIGYNVRGPWSFLMAPKRKIVEGGPSALSLRSEDTWFILSYPDCRSKKQWEECCTLLETWKVQGVAWTSAAKSGKEQIVRLSSKAVDVMRSWNG